jgi:hypothetical protein
MTCLTTLIQIEENDLFDYINSNRGDYSGGDVSDLFSNSIYNSDFRSPLSDKQKQLIEECCSEVDGLGRVDDLLRLEDNLKLFLSQCSVIKSSKGKASSEGSQDDSIERVRQTVPMTNGKYQGSAKRIFNSHHM